MADQDQDAAHEHEGLGLWRARLASPSPEALSRGREVVVMAQLLQALALHGWVTIGKLRCAQRLAVDSGEGRQ